MYMLHKAPEVPVRPQYIWLDDEARGFVVGRTAKNLFGGLLRRGNPILRTEFLMCDPNHRLGVLAMNRQEEKRIGRMFDPMPTPGEPDPKVLEIRGIVTMNRRNRFRGTGLEPGAMVIGPLVLGEVVEWTRSAIDDGMHVAAHSRPALDKAYGEYDRLVQLADRIAGADI